MAETRKQLKERLQAAGQWDEFVTVRSKLAAEGMRPADAKVEALRLVESNSCNPAEPDTRKIEPDGLLATTPKEVPDFTRNVANSEAVQWVALNLANPHVRATDAPGGQAWGLLLWVRRSPANESSFWASLWPKLSPPPKQPVEEDTEPCLELVDSLLDQFHAQQRREDAELAMRPDAAEFAGTLQKKLASALKREEELLKRLQEMDGGRTAKPSE